MLNSIAISGKLLDDGWNNELSTFMKLEVAYDFVVTLRMSRTKRESILHLVGKEVAILGKIGKVRHYDKVREKYLYDISIWVDFVEENKNEK